MLPLRQAVDRRVDARTGASVIESDPAAERSRSTFIGCIERLDVLIERETEALKTSAVIDFEDFNLRKTHALLEFSRASRSFAAPMSGAVEAKLNKLRARLTENSSLLDQRLRAMREIADIMIRTIEMAESDGTYSTRFLADR